jgi:predicted hotdog family 3-hydroxylacyl-ACP dehydratase
MAERPLPAALIPHRGPSLLVESIVDAGPEEAVCRGHVPVGSAFVVGGRVAALVAIELAAQTAAVHQALAAPSPDAAQRTGYLVGVREASLRADWLPADVALVATVRRLAAAGPLATYSVSVTGPDGAEILTATLSTHAAR